MNIASLVRPNILLLTPYSSARDEYKGDEGTFLDANENPFGNLNRYPDPHQRTLKQHMSAIKSIPAEQIFAGNGSDEVIDLLFRVFCTPSIDKIVTCPPTYGMYEVSANINAVENICVPLTADFQLDIDGILGIDAKMVFICNPNNPSANSIDEIDRVLENFKGIVVVDEAYIDFSERPSFISKISKYPNLVVMQTLSKAWGMAAARIGFAYASTEIIGLLNKVKPPYNISKLNQEAAIEAVQNISQFEINKRLILDQRITVSNALLHLPFVSKVHPSDTNFLLVEVDDANGIYDYLVTQKVIVRNRHSVVRNNLRITIGSPAENIHLLNMLNECKK